MDSTQVSPIAICLATSTGVAFHTPPFCFQQQQQHIKGAELDLTWETSDSSQTTFRPALLRTPPTHGAACIQHLQTFRTSFLNLSKRQKWDWATAEKQFETQEGSLHFIFLNVCVGTVLLCGTPLKTSMNPL